MLLDEEAVLGQGLPRAWRGWRCPGADAQPSAAGAAREQARVSTTDAEASVMTMGEEGFRPADNPPCATDTQGQAITPSPTT
jgi:hypothetical protein